MSTLTIKHQWLKHWDVLGKKDIVPAQIAVTCGGEKTTFEFPYRIGQYEKTYDGDGACLLEVVHPVSDVATESDCETSISLKQDLTCEFYSVPFAAGVPALTSIGIAVAIVATLVIGLATLRRS